MGDNEIIKALECCQKGNCDECPFCGRKEDCEVELPEESLKLVNRLKAEIDRLQLESAKNTYFVSSRNSGKVYQTMSRMINLHDVIIKGVAEQIKSALLKEKLLSRDDIPVIIDNLVKERVSEYEQN